MADNKVTLGKVSFVPRGEWSSSTKYDALDVVYANGQSYVAHEASTGVDPTTDTQETTWHILATRGQQGPKGDQGPQGDRGIQGVQGPKGDQGIQGPKGDKGDQGSRGYNFWTMKMTAGGNVRDRWITDLYNASKNNLPVVGDTVLQPDGNVYEITGVSYADDGSNGGGTFSLGDVLFSTKGATGPQGPQGPQGPKGDMDLSQITVGGRNLLLGTRDFSGDNWLNLNDVWKKTNETYNGLTVVETTGDWSGITQYYQLEQGETYTFSLFARYKSGTGTSQIYLGLNSNPENGKKSADVNNSRAGCSVDENWKKFSVTFTSRNDGYIKPRIERTDNNTNVLQVCGFMLEKGNVATDWTPAPEDIDTRVNNLSVGGRNLYLNSRALADNYAPNGDTTVTIEPFDSTTNMWHIVAKQGSGSAIGIYIVDYAKGKIPDNSYWSYSFDIKGTGDIFELGIEVSDRNSAKGTIGSEWSRISQTGHVGNPQYKTLVMYFDTTNSPLDVYIKLPKLEIGNMPTDWTPAPEDVDAKFNSLSIGGRNYLFNSSGDTLSGWDMDTSNWSVTSDDIRGNVFTSTPSTAWTGGGLNSISQERARTLIGKQVTVSFWAKSSVDNANFHSEPQGGANSFDRKLTTTWTRYSYTISSFSGRIYFMSVDAGTTYYLDDIKLEAGNVATDWTPAPEDVPSGLSVGGRNLLLDTGRSFTGVGANQNNGNFDAQNGKFYLSGGKKVSDLYNQYGPSGYLTLSFDWVADGSTISGHFNPQWDVMPWNSGITDTVYLSNNNKSGHYKTSIPLTSVGYSTGVATSIQFRQDNLQGNITISNMKLEAGNVATDWTPAPEDVPRGQILDGKDLNGYQDVYTYIIDGANNLVNYPSGASTWAVLEVEQINPTTTIQRLIDTNNRIFIRTLGGNPPLWSSWNQVANDANVVHNTGNDTVAGDKTFTGKVTVSGTLDAMQKIYSRTVGTTKDLQIMYTRVGNVVTGRYNVKLAGTFPLGANDGYKSTSGYPVNVIAGGGVDAWFTIDNQFVAKGASEGNFMFITSDPLPSN